MAFIRQGCAKREVLEYIRNQNNAGIPAYDEHLGRNVGVNWKQFWSERDLLRYLEKLESEGLVAIHKKHFVNITEAGRIALGGNP